MRVNSREDNQKSPTDLARHMTQGNKQRQEYDYAVEDRLRLKLHTLRDKLPDLTSAELEELESGLDAFRRMAELFLKRHRPIAVDEQPGPAVAGHERRTAPHGQATGFDGTADNPLPLTTDIGTINFAGLIKLADKLDVPHDEDQWLDDEYPDKTDDLRVAVAEAAEKVGEMTREELDKIMSGDSDFSAYKGKSRVMLGLNLISKYVPDPDISPAHDIIYVCDADELLKAGLTEADADELRKMNWMIDSEFDCFAIFT